ncbi:hypothetical protein AXF42_Ash009765 [Apostasia shenzhenica]|uniref:RAB6-interacting golgin n=1 Tax=Apostasia shenzhenica TaxID=1088818 RepID=A0A2I0AX17_9ASPA|nr:hypothetical protein AXF42_Ash009765 [Apostasia shenzhenica]
MASSNSKPSLVEIGPDGLAREAPVIAYTEKVIEEEQLQLKRYIQENYSKIRDVEREFESLTLEVKLTAGPKRAALEHLRKKIELANERIRAAKSKEELAKKAWEAAALVVRDEEVVKQKLCDDLNQLVQESANTQYSRLEELKRRLEALNPSRVSCDVLACSNAATTQQATDSAVHPSSDDSGSNDNIRIASENQAQNAEVKEKKRILNPGRGKKNIPKSRIASESGWTGAGFDVDGRTL